MKDFSRSNKIKQFDFCFFVFCCCFYDTLFDSRNKCQTFLFFFCLHSNARFWLFHPHLLIGTLFILLLNLSIDQAELLAAKTFLEQAAITNIAEFLKALSDVLVNINYSPVARTAAGLQLKNHLTSKDPTITDQYHKRWLSFPEATRDYIKNNVS